MTCSAATSLPGLTFCAQVRDKIYALLLTSRMSAADQKKHNLLSKKPNSRRKTLALDALKEKTAILPGSVTKYSFIASAQGLLLTCKQLHAEANAYLFSSNTFTVMPESGREHCFWSCNGASCRPDIPCLVHVRNIMQIKHLYVLVNNPHAFEARAQGYAAKRLKANLATIARCLKEVGVKLLTLKVQYLSCMNGQVEERREEFDAEPEEDEEGREIAMRSADHDIKYTFSAGQDHSILFQNTKVLDKLKTLRGIAESVTIVGDLPSSYVTELTDILSVAQEVEEGSEMTEFEEAHLGDDEEDSSIAMAEETPELQHSQQDDEDAGAMVIDEQPESHHPHTDEADPLAKTTQGPGPEPLEQTGGDHTGSQINPSRAKAEAQRARQSETDKDREAFFQKLAKKHPGDTEMKELCSKIMRRSNYSPAIMEQLFAPPSKEELKRFRAMQKKKR